MEKLSLQNFLVFRDVDIELRRINIFIGPQAQGKSILTKLIYFFQNFAQGVQSAAYDTLNKRQFDASCCARFESIFPSYAWCSSEFRIKYTCDSFWVELSNEKVGAKCKLKIKYQDNIYKALSAGKAVMKKYSLAEPEQQEELLMNPLGEIRAILLTALRSNEYSARFHSCHYIPAGRSFFANLQKSIFSFISVSAPIDYFLKEFGSLYERTRDSHFIAFVHRKKTRSRLVSKIVEDLICGKYVTEKGQDWIVGPAGKIRLENSSSGQQEALPLALVLSTWPYFANRSTATDFIIEEPEAHLFPVAQGQVVSLIASAYNSEGNPGRYTITTHSPYILTAFNNLIQAGNVHRVMRNRDSEKALFSVVPKEQLVHYEDVMAYYVDSAAVVSIMDDDLSLINANAIDKVSDVFSSKFEKLIEMEVKNESAVHK